MLLLDPILASGSSALAAIDLLLAKGVSEQRIIFLTLIASPPGIKRVCEAYPHLTVVTSELDAALSPTHVVLPGIGEFGDRYFGTDCISEDRPGEEAYGSLTPGVSAAAAAARARLIARAQGDGLQLEPQTLAFGGNGGSAVKLTPT